MGLFDGSGDGGMGLMGMYANPQTAALLGMSQGLLSAAGPSRIPVSMGQAMGAGLQGMQQNAGNALQMQQQMLRMQAMQGLMGGGQPSGQTQQSSAPSYSSLFGPNSNQPASMAPSGVGGSQDGSSAAGAPAEGSIYGKSPQQLFQQGMLMNMAGIQGGGDLMRVAVEHDPTLARQMPTDIQKNAAAAFGYGTPEYLNAIQGTVRKEGIIPLRPGAGYIDNGVLKSTPGAAPAGYMNQPNGDGTWSIVPVSGGAEAVKSSAAAGAIGKAYGTNTTGYQNGQPVYVNQGQLSDQLTNGGPGVPGFTPFQNAIRQVESQGNPAAVNPASGAAGSMQVTPTGAGSGNPGFGVTPARNNSPQELQRVGADYANAMQQRYGNDTDAAVAYNWGPGNADKWIQAGRPWKMLPAETQSYVGQVHAQMQNFAGQQGPAGISPELAPGAKNAANTAQNAPSQQMADMQSHLADSDNTYQQSRQAIQKMISIAQNQGIGDTASRFLPQDVATRINENAAEYQKAHANFVSLQGKALGSGGTDASRATLDEAVPTFDKPQAAKLSGLNDQLNQLDWNHLKRQALNPIFQQGNEKAYTQQSAAFDNAIQPSMMPQLNRYMSMPAGPARTAALQQAIADPKMKAALDLMVQTGQLK
jgi:hypothetical protein